MEGVMIEGRKRGAGSAFRSWGECGKLRLLGQVLPNFEEDDEMKKIEYGIWGVGELGVESNC